MKYVNFKSGIAALGMLIVSVNGMAQSATVTFSGTVKTTTCSLTVAGPASAGTTTATTTTVSSSSGTASIFLPSIAPSQLTGAVGTTAGTTAIALGVSGCAVSSGLTPTIYLSSSVASGGYIPTGLSGISFQLLDSTSSAITLTTSPTYNASLTALGTGTSASLTYYIRYIATAATVTAVGSSSAATMTVTLYYV